jgi:predicted secreted protein
MGTPTSNKGLVFILRVLTSTGPDVWTPVAAQRGGTFTFNTEPIDVTHKGGLLLLGTGDSALAIEAKHGDATLAVVNPAAINQSLDVTVTAAAVVVSLATDGDGVITSTATDVLDAIEADSDADELLAVTLADDSDGTGICATLAAVQIAMWRLIVPGLRSFQFSGSGLYATSDDARAALEAAFDDGDPVQCEFAWDETPIYTGAGTITSLSVSGETSDMGMYEITVDGTDELD